MLAGETNCFISAWQKMWCLLLQVEIAFYDASLIHYFCGFVLFSTFWMHTGVNFLFNRTIYCKQLCYKLRNSDARFAC